MVRPRKNVTEATSKTKITVAIDKDVMASFSQTTKNLGLRRDAYLNMVLPDEIDALSKVPQSSEDGLHIGRSLWVVNPKASITLDRGLANRMTEVCAEKNVSRDMFMEKCLEHLNGVLDKAAAYVTNPGTHRAPDTYMQLVTKKGDAKRLVAELERLLKIKKSRKR